jgi:DtxR family Mn-dependent transcriptional regulator
MMSVESAEEYLECIYDLTKNGDPAKTNDIAARMDIGPGSVTEMIQKLADRGHLDYQKYKGVTLTEKGLVLARKVKRKHRILESFLVNFLGMNRGDSHEEACRLEHTISDESEKRLCLMMDNPKLCPDGEPIPKCEEDCALCEREPSVSLTRMRKGEHGLITHLRCDKSPEKIRKLISMGLVPGRRVKVEEEAPIGGALVIGLGESKVALGKEYASLVHVGNITNRNESPRRQSRRVKTRL